MRCKITCEECGKVFSSPHEARLHEENCPPDYVVFSKVFARKQKASRNPESLPDWAENYLSDGKKWNKEHEKKKEG